MDDEDEEESMMKSANTLALSESDLKIFEEKWEAAKTQQKNLFLIIFQVVFNVLYEWHCNYFIFPPILLYHNSNVDAAYSCAIFFCRDSS